MRREPRRFNVVAPDGAVLRVWEFAPREVTTAEALTVILAHGWTLTHRSWLPGVELLQAQRDVRVVLYDQRERDRLTPVRHSRRLAELATHADLRILTGRGHMLGYEAAGEVASALVELVDGVPAQA